MTPKVAQVQITILMKPFKIKKNVPGVSENKDMVT